MTADHFVGRKNAINLLAAVLEGRKRAEGSLTIQSVEGPGGIGKTCLFDHVLSRTNLADKNYLTFRINGNDSAIRDGVVSSVAKMVGTAEAEAIRRRPPGYYFPTVTRIKKIIETICNEALAEFQRKHPNSTHEPSEFRQYLDFAIILGKTLNAASLVDEKKVNFSKIEKYIPELVSLQEKMPPVWERLGVGGSTAERNAVKRNALESITEAFVSDLSAILVEYQGKDRRKAAHRKIKGIDRLLLIFDDYEVLQGTLGECLVGYLLPRLQRAHFESTVVLLGRDQLEATHTAWDHHFRNNVLERITLDPLSRAEMDQLVGLHGIQAPEEKDRAWRDTQGYPFYVQLWAEEVESGGRSAVMLKRFHDRTTRWMNKQQKQWLYQILFVDKINIRNLQDTLGSRDEAEEAFRWFEVEGSVRDTVGDSFRIREYIRSRLVDYLRITDPDHCEELESRGRSVKATHV